MRRMRGVIRGLIVVGLALGMGSGSLLGQTPLAWKFTPGQVLHYEVTTQTTNKAGSGSLTTTLVIDVRHKVESVDAAGTASITQTIDRIRLRMESPQKAPSEYDTAAGQKPEGLAAWMVPSFKTVLNKPITLKITRQGKISDLKLPRGLAEQVQKAVGGDMWGNAFTAPGIGQMLGLAELPDQPAMPGNRWSQNVLLDNPGFCQQSIEMIYDYQGNEDQGGRPLARIASTAKTSFIAGPDASIYVTVRNEKTQGSFAFDPSAGRLVESSLESRMNLHAILMSKGRNKDMAVISTKADKALDQESIQVRRVRVELVPAAETARK